jgi:hypothetical protein
MPKIRARGKLHRNDKLVRQTMPICRLEKSSPTSSPGSSSWWRARKENTLVNTVLNSVVIGLYIWPWHVLWGFCYNKYDWFTAITSCNWALWLVVWLINKDFHNNNLLTVKCMLRQGTKLVACQYFPTFSLISGTIYNGACEYKYKRHILVLLWAQ